MPTTARAIAEQPRMAVVYSRDDFSKIALPERVPEYPELRYMGSKHRLLPWIHGCLLYTSRCV